MSLALWQLEIEDEFVKKSFFFDHFQFFIEKQDAILAHSPICARSH